jgi:hypothetical protein
MAKYDSNPPAPIEGRPSDRPSKPAGLPLCEMCTRLEARGPNADTREAMAELEAGGGYTVSTVEEMMALLRADD